MGDETSFDRSVQSMSICAGNKISVLGSESGVSGDLGFGLDLLARCNL